MIKQKKWWTKNVVRFNLGRIIFSFHVCLSILKYTTTLFNSLYDVVYQVDFEGEQQHFVYIYCVNKMQEICNIHLLQEN